MSPAVVWRGRRGYWVHWFRDPLGERKQKWTKLNSRNPKEARQEAKILEGDWIKRTQTNGGMGGEPQDLLWDDLVEKYIIASESDRNCEGTLARKRAHFKHIRRMTAVVMASDWSYAAFEEFKRRCKLDDAAAGSVNKELGLIKAALRLARRLKFKAPSADDLRDVRQVRNRPPSPVFFTMEDVVNILGVASLFWRVATLLGGLAGLRRAEALALRWVDINFCSRELRVADREDWREKTRRSKSIPIHRDLLQVLTEWKAQNPNQVYVLPWDKGANEFSHFFRRLCKKAGLQTGCYKGLRHGFATGLMQLDVNAMKVQRAMGHSLISTTQRYTHVRAADLHEAIEKLPSPLLQCDRVSNKPLTKSGISANAEPGGATSSTTMEAGHA